LSAVASTPWPFVLAGLLGLLLQVVGLVAVKLTGSVTFKLLLQPMVLICSTLEAKDGMTVVPRHEGAVAKC
jgi:hypothetical protein